MELLASGGTYKALADAGLAVTEVSDYTGQPEILGGRVKTLHPKLHGGILARRDGRRGPATRCKAQGIEPIDLVVVNLYPFEETIARPDVTVRGGGREHRHRRPEPDPRRGQEPCARRRPDRRRSSTAEVIELPATHGGTTSDVRRWLAAAVFERPARTTRRSPTTCWPGRFRQVSEHASPTASRPSSAPASNVAHGAPLRREPAPAGRLLRRARNRPARTWPPRRILHGKELSYNNLLDLDSALRLIRSVRRAGGLRPQAQQPLRRGRGRLAWPRRSSWPTRGTRSAPSAASSA